METVNNYILNTLINKVDSSCIQKVSKKFVIVPFNYLTLKEELECIIYNEKVKPLNLNINFDEYKNHLEEGIIEKMIYETINTLLNTVELNYSTNDMFTNIQNRKLYYKYFKKEINMYTRKEWSNIFYRMYISKNKNLFKSTLHLNENIEKIKLNNDLLLVNKVIEMRRNEKI